MTTDTQSILCGACRIPVEGPAKPQSQDVFSCPDCGRSDSFENVMASAQAFITELAKSSLQKSMRKAFRKNKGIKITSQPIPKKVYRFITNHQL